MEKEYVVAVALIHTKDEKGRPKLVTLGYDDTTYQLAGGEEFMTTLIPKVMIP
jgi:hypothetical protein